MNWLRFIGFVLVWLFIAALPLFHVRSPGGQDVAAALNSSYLHNLPYPLSLEENER